MRRGQSSTASLLFFRTSRHHSVFPTPLVLQPPASHQPWDAVSSMASPMGTPPGKTGSKAMVSKNQTLH